MNPVGPFTLTTSGMRSMKFLNLEDAHDLAKKRLAQGKRSVIFDRNGQQCGSYEEASSTP